MFFVVECVGVWVYFWVLHVCVFVYQCLCVCVCVRVGVCGINAYTHGLTHARHTLQKESLSCLFGKVVVCLHWRNLKAWLVEGVSAVFVML